jgi:hypothetical protein
VGKDTKTHQQRRIALDVTTVGLLRAYRRDCDEVAASLGVEVSPSGRLFSASPDHSTWLVPSSVSQRFARMCARLGWDRNIHELRHYSATELISAGVDIRTVAGRLGHSGGGTTTLRTYAAWVSEADQRAAGTFDNHMPALPVNLEDLDQVVLTPGAEAIRAAAAPYRPMIGRTPGEPRRRPPIRLPCPRRATTGRVHTPRAARGWLAVAGTT